MIVMLTREEFDKVLEQQTDDLKAHIGDYVLSKVGVEAGEDTQRVFPLALFQYSASLLLESLVNDVPSWLKTDFMEMLSSNVSKFVRTYNMVTGVAQGIAEMKAQDNRKTNI